MSGLRERVSELEDKDEKKEKRIEDLEKQMKDINNRLLLLGNMSGGSGEGIDTNALQALLDSLRKEFEDKFASKDEMEDLKARVEKLEHSVSDLDEKTTEHDS